MLKKESSDATVTDPTEDPVVEVLQEIGYGDTADDTPTDTGHASLQASPAGAATARVSKARSASAPATDSHAAADGHVARSSSRPTATRQAVREARRADQDRNRNRPSRSKSALEARAEYEAQERKRLHFDLEIRFERSLFFPALSAALLVGIFIDWFTAAVATAGFLIHVIVTLIHRKRAADV